MFWPAALPSLPYCSLEYSRSYFKKSTGSHLFKKALRDTAALTSFISESERGCTTPFPGLAKIKYEYDPAFHLAFEAGRSSSACSNSVIYLRFQAINTATSLKSLEVSWPEEPATSRATVTRFCALGRSSNKISHSPKSIHGSNRCKDSFDRNAQSVAFSVNRQVPSAFFATLPSSSIFFRM